MAHHEIPVRVYYEDTDAGGIVFYANYLKYAERGRTELLRAAGLENRSILMEDGLLFVVRRVEADYLKPARLDDLLTVKTGVKTINNASFVMKQTIFCHDSMLFSMDVTLVCVTKEAKPVRVPDAIKQKLLNFADLETPA